MSALTGVASVTFPVRRRNNGRNYFKAIIALGDGSSTYPAGGIPLVIAQFGCPNDLESMEVFDDGNSGYKFSYDFTNKALRMYVGGSHTHNLLLKNAAVVDGATTRVNAGANLLGANTGGDLTVAGGGANGGVVAAVAGLSEVATGAVIAAITIRAELIGW